MVAYNEGFNLALSSFASFSVQSFLGGITSVSARGLDSLTPFDFSRRTLEVILTFHRLLRAFLRQH